MPSLPPETTPAEETWRALDPNATLRHLATSPEGLTTSEARRRLVRYGPNQLAEAPPPSFWSKLWEQFNNFVVWLLIVAAVVSAALGDWVEAAAIMAIVILNAVLGLVQESRAEQALAKLRQMAAPEAHVIRDGRRQVVPAREVVPGDIVLLEAGNYVPADVRLLESVNLRIDESALTGESSPVTKDATIVIRDNVPVGDQKNMAFMGTVVSYGRGRGVVVSTGMRTQLGMIAQMLHAVEIEPTPLQKRLDELGRTLGWGALAVCGLVFVVGWARGFNPLDMFLIAVSLAIAAVPEGLPAVVTISLALGMREMVKRHALIRRLASVETLGSTTVICSDKTGTLTQNEMTATRLWVDGRTFEITGQGYAPEGEFLLEDKPIEPWKYPALTTALWIAALNNDALLETSGASDMRQTFRVVGDPTEGALVVAAAKAGAFKEALEEDYPRVQEIPFDSARKRMVTIHAIREPHPDDASPFTTEKVSGYAVTVKGAPDVVLGLCSRYQRLDDVSEPLTPAMREAIMRANDELTGQALRVLAVAYKVIPDLPEDLDPDAIESDLIFVGLFGMIDPPRPEVIPALAKAQHAGIRTVMITGDYPNTARAIAERIGLLRPGHKVLTGAQLDALPAEAWPQAVEEADVFARVSPEHKLRLVEALQADGEVVAMTGDGVNDAPAIKKADIGIAMGITGTDVAKETADMVLTDDNYASIVAAIEQGRVIYSNIRKFVYYLLSCNLAEIAVIFLATLAGLPSPLTAIQLLWLNLITDGAPALALGVEKGDPDIMDRPPRPPDEPIINRPMWLGITVQTIAITGVTLGAYAIGLHVHPNQPEFAETMAFATLSFSELLRAFTARSERYPILKIGLFSNRSMNLAFLTSALLLLAVIYVPGLNTVFNAVPLGWTQWRLMLPLLALPAVAAELTKTYLRWREKH
ncbi:MAG TPA: calcium-translocating P-type ATPase, SERCA-type [Chloroflexi bacterium]|nr:calcium-translocating P-type ATPase, SERCA-type [Chloroflexota bacterium]